MGGPCILSDAEGQRTAPACTDNFQVKPFLFDGKEWQSVEACFQGMKFLDASVRESIRTIKKEDDLTDAGHGLLVWQKGQCSAETRPDWNAVKLKVMFRVCFAKYAQHLDLQEELLSTGSAEICGGPSTSWVTKSGKETNWSEWNGNIQMLIREFLRSPPVRNAALLDSLSASLEEYMVDEGGLTLPLPGCGNIPIGEVVADKTKLWIETCARGSCVDSCGSQWQEWAGADTVAARALVESLLNLGLDDGKYSEVVGKVLEMLVHSADGLSNVVAKCLDDYSDDIVEDIALDNPKASQLVTRVRNAVKPIAAE